MTRFTLNGVEVSSASHPLTRLLDVLRDELGDLSLKEGCGEGECGACSVLLDGRLANACLLPLGRADGCAIVTMAGVRDTPRGKSLVEAFAREGAVQCGFCTPGLVMAAEALLSADPAPDEQAIRVGLSGNLCRCTGYETVVRAVAAAAREGRGRW
jgi:carbon-monoxide dehydrogenase small subunit